MATNKKTIIITNYHQPYPPRDGAAARCIDLLKAFQALGYHVVLFTSDLIYSYALSKEEILKAETELKIEVVVYPSTLKERTYIQSKIFKWNAYVTPGLIKFFALLYKSVQPELVLVNFVFWADLAMGEQFKRSINMIDAIDLLSLNQKMAALTFKYLDKGAVNKHSQYEIAGANNDMLDENFFSRFNLSAEQEEYNKYDEYDLAIAINPKEKELIEQNTHNTKCIYLPFAFAVSNADKMYTDPPIFAIGANQFNYQGYLYFAKRVLPEILKKRPDFTLHVVGDGCKRLEATPGIKLLGFVPDLNAMYSKSKFAVCPLIGATGQQLKVMEAMAKGLPVVALRNVAERCPIIHNVNGLIADNALEFAEYTLRLYSDPALCERMGGEAMKTIEQQFNLPQLTNKLTQTLQELKKGKIPSFGAAGRLYWQLVLSTNFLLRKYMIKYEQTSLSKQLIYRMKTRVKALIRPTHV